VVINPHPHFTNTLRNSANVMPGRTLASRRSSNSDTLVGRVGARRAGMVAWSIAVNGNDRSAIYGRAAISLHLPSIAYVLFRGLGLTSSGRSSDMCVTLGGTRSSIPANWSMFEPDTSLRRLRTSTRIFLDSQANLAVQGFNERCCRCMSHWSLTRSPGLTKVPAPIVCTTGDIFPEEWPSRDHIHCRFHKIGLVSIHQGTKTAWAEHLVRHPVILQGRGVNAHSITRWPATKHHAKVSIFIIYCTRSRSRRSPFPSVKSAGVPVVLEDFVARIPNILDEKLQANGIGEVISDRHCVRGG